MSLAFEELFAVADAFGHMHTAGRTDAWILSDAAALHAVDPVVLARFRSLYVSRLAAEIHKPGPRKGVMPGVRQLLDVLSGRDDVFLALLTGNYQDAARIKLEYFDLWRYFRCGAIGDESHDRNSLLGAALDEVRKCGTVPQPSDVVVIGDTPLDVACAASGGARSIAVATGSHSEDELRAAGADVVLQDLGDTRQVLHALQLQLAD
jgi:phosphoglycolate phosphatase-like HAD superfamily hydrolase